MSTSEFNVLEQAEEFSDPSLYVSELPGLSVAQPAPSKLAGALRQFILRPGVAAAFGIGFLIVVWWILSVTLPAHVDTIATPLATLRSIVDSRSTIWSATTTTLGEAAIGFAFGNIVGMLLAISFVQSKVAERAVLQLAIVTHCLPVIAIGPLLELVLSGSEPRIVMSALLVFFPTVVTVQVGLRQTDRVALEIVRVYGGSKLHQLRYVRLMTAAPYILTALKVTAPLAILGAILGEFMGGVGGLGALIISTQDQNNIPLTWAIALVCTSLSMITFVAFGAIGHALFPWAPRTKVRV